MRSISTGLACSSQDIDHGDFKSAVLPELLDNARVVFRDLPGRHSEMTDDEILQHISVDLLERLTHRLSLEYLCTGNLDAFGRGTFLISSELTALLSRIDPSVEVSLLSLPKPCVQLVYDCQTMRDAVMAVPGDVGPREGTVSVYAMETLLNGLRALTFHAYLIDRSRVLAYAEGNALLTAGISLGAAISRGVVEGNTAAFANGTTSSRVSLRTIVANTLLYLCSANASVVPGLRRAPVGVSARAMRCTSLSTTDLDYSVVGGWLPLTRYQSWEWNVEGKRVALAPR